VSPWISDSFVFLDNSVESGVLRLPSSSLLPPSLLPPSSSVSSSSVLLSHPTSSTLLLLPLSSSPPPPSSLYLSTAPFCSGLYGITAFLSKPHFFFKSSITPLINDGSLSLWIIRGTPKSANNCVSAHAISPRSLVCSGLFHPLCLLHPPFSSPPPPSSSSSVLPSSFSSVGTDWFKCSYLIWGFGRVLIVISFGFWAC